MKYAQINFETNQMQGQVQNLPQRWTTKEGSTINNFNQLPQEALFGLGWVPVVYESITPETHIHSLTPVWNQENKQFIFPSVARDIELLKTEARAKLDKIAGEASARYITIASGQESRYLIKAKEASDYIKAIEGGETPVAQDYPFVKLEAEACGETYEAIAQMILDKKKEWVQKGAIIESVRISGKSAIFNAKTAADVISIRDTAIQHLEAV